MACSNQRAGEIINGRSTRPACVGSSISFDTTRRKSSVQKFWQNGRVYPVHGSWGGSGRAEKDRIESGLQVLTLSKDVEGILGRLHELYVKDPSSISAKGLGSPMVHISVR